MNIFESATRAKLEKRRQEESLRKLSVQTTPLIDFISNDYLGLARSEELFRMIQQKTDDLLPHRNGAAGSRLLSGNSTYTEEVESRLAVLFQSESALIFNSGYTANLGVFSSLPQKGDTILYDELSHASIKDGIRLSLASRYSFRHNDLADLERKMRQSTGTIFIGIESIYSMDGDECPLESVVALSKEHNAVIILDEAHSTGTYGKYGSGLSISLGLQNDIHVRIYTFGKAMGIHGACVASSQILKDYIINFSRPFIYTTAMSPHCIVAIDCAFEFLKTNEHLAEDLHKRINLFRSTFKSETGSKSAIQPVVLPGNSIIKEAASTLFNAGFDVRPVLSPTVKSGTERLRICLHAFNSDEEIHKLTAMLNVIKS